MADIEHVVVLMLENRSYDHLLGYVPHPDPSFDGLPGRAFANPGWGRGGARPLHDPPVHHRSRPGDQRPEADWGEHVTDDEYNGR